MDDLDLFDDHLTAADATLLVAAIDDDHGDTDPPDECGVGRDTGAARSGGPGDGRSTAGCSGCGCLVAAALGSVALRAAASRPTSLVTGAFAGGLASTAVAASGLASWVLRTHARAERVTWLTRACRALARDGRTRRGRT
jgi:hypothetical protein